ESTERGLGGGKDISVYSVAESYKKQIWFSIIYSRKSDRREDFVLISNNQRRKDWKVINIFT
ncbi:MAG: hypothetical protein ACNYWM_12150, partial [Methanosarcinales archaeon]